MRKSPIRLRYPLLLLLLLAPVAWLYWYATSPMQGSRSDYPVAFSVEQGSTLKTAARDMEMAGVLRQSWAFILLARLKGLETSIKAGSYALNTPATPLDLLRKITEGDTVLGKLTIPEGWSFAEMRRLVDSHPHLRHDTLGLTTAQLLQAIGAADGHPEGRFFPDTYFFDQGSSDLALYQRAYTALRQQLDKAWAARAPGLPYRSPDEALTMASIIEKETGAPEERPLIAAVFINRMKIGMRLQTDPTVIYGLGDKFDGNLRRDDLLTDTPYNTYTRAGLPPTPIALPGAAALHAAMNPETSRALYFVAKGGGRHVFSDNLDAHNRAVNRYQRGR
jgi:UPF0755 protein